MNFEELCEANGIHLSEEQLKKFEIYKELLKKWGSRINLTSLLSDRDIEVKHFLDSLLGLRAFEVAGIEVSNKLFADVGSGAGFPGIPLAIVLGSSKFDLIESRHKRCVFLEQVKRELPARNVSVVCKRVEDVEADYDILLMRAVKDPLSAVKLVKHLLRGSTVLCIYRGKESFEGELKGFSYEEIDIPVIGLDIRRKFLFIWRACERYK